VPKRVGPSRTQFKISSDMVANGHGSYKELQLLFEDTLTKKSG